MIFPFNPGMCKQLSSNKQLEVSTTLIKHFEGYKDKKNTFWSGGAVYKIIIRLAKQLRRFFCQL